jgi:hypothetical protein
MIREINENRGDYLFCHSDLNGCRMHLNSVAHRNLDKIDVHHFSSYKRCFSGHIHIRQVNSNFEFIGSLYQMDRNDTGDQKGVTILDLDSGVIDFIPNDYSPVFRKISIINEDDIDSLVDIKESKDYIDLKISNNLLINRRKLRRKLETILESGSFASVEYIDDIKRDEDLEGISEGIVSVEGEESEIDISIQLDYEDFIRDFINRQNYENSKYKSGILEEYNEIIRLYNENYRILDN